MLVYLALSAGREGGRETGGWEIGEGVRGKEK
jgi:hypothetical protein